jgi:TIR domain
VGKQQPFDVLFNYDEKDELHVLKVANKLRDYGLYPWIKVEQVRPGTFSQDVIQKAIQSINCAAIFLGLGKLIDFQLMELNAHISEITEKGKILIPVLLPGVDQIPDDMLFLREIHSVHFANGIDDRKAI